MVKIKNNLNLKIMITLTNKNFDQETAEGIVLIDIKADWCGPCKMIAPLIEELAKEVTDAKVVKVDVDASPEIGARFQVRSIPTFIVLKDGVMVDKVVGAKNNKEFYLELIEKAK